MNNQRFSSILLGNQTCWISLMVFNPMRWVEHFSLFLWSRFVRAHLSRKYLNFISTKALRILQAVSRMPRCEFKDHSLWPSTVCLLLCGFGVLNYRIHSNIQLLSQHLSFDEMRGEWRNFHETHANEMRADSVIPLLNAKKSVSSTLIA